MGWVSEFIQMVGVSLNNKQDRNRFAHFCEHDGIHIRFTRARSIWHAVAPSTIRPWWILLEPTKAIHQYSNTNNKNNIEAEVTENV